MEQFISSSFSIYSYAICGLVLGGEGFGSWDLGLG